MTKSNPIIIDCQIFQTFSWDRGMGKYSLELIRALSQNEEFANRDVVLLFNKLLKNNDDAEAQLKTIVPTAEFEYVELNLPKDDRVHNNIQPVRLKNKQILGDYIEGRNFSKKPDFLILSLYLDEVCAVFPERKFVNQDLLLYYDSIPFLYHERYGRMEGFFDHFYLPHTASVFEADKVFTISKTVANDLHLYFGVLKSKIFNIDGASIPRSANKPVMPKDWKYKPGEFVLMPTGQELRKNNDRAVEAFDLFVDERGTEIPLFITSHFSDEGRSYLKEKSKRVNFTGNVSEAELLWLYQNCKFVLFPSEYEGLGLPILEAVEQDKLIACSNISVFKEMSQTAFNYFDPIDVTSIKNTLLEADRNGVVDSKLYDVVKENYTWNNTAKRFIDGLTAEVKLPQVKKKKIAIFAPDVSGFSAIGKDIGELHAIYSEYFDVEYYFDKGPNHRELRPNILKYAAPWFDAKDFQEGDDKKYDALIYHIGNSEYHLNISRVALRYPGYVILHDTNLGGLYYNLVDLGYVSKQRYDVEEKLESMIAKDHKLHADKGSYLASILNNQHAVIVHSEYAKHAVAAKLLSAKKLVHLELPFSTPPFPGILPVSTANATPTIAFAGIIAPIKGIDIMEKIALNSQFSECQINIFGFSAGNSDQLNKLRAFPNVRVITNPSDFEFQNLLIKSDIMINVRMAYKGETSGSTLSHMRYGGASIVRKFGWFDELPNDVVVKVDDPSATLVALRELVLNPKKLANVRKHALAFMETHHDHEVYTKGMYDLIK